MNALFEWLGAGGVPVQKSLAEERAKVCETCQFNRSPLWWEKMIKDPIAAVMRAQLAIKNGMKLQVANEDSLHVCAACGCCIPLKIFTPITHIKAATTQEQLDRYPSFCWITKESKQA